MSLQPRAIAVEGVGYDPIGLATLGWISQAGAGITGSLVQTLDLGVLALGQVAIRGLGGGALTGVADGLGQAWIAGSLQEFLDVLAGAEGRVGISGSLQELLGLSQLGEGQVFIVGAAEGSLEFVVVAGGRVVGRGQVFLSDRVLGRVVLSRWPN